jgi:hypothetical protein
MALPLSPTTPFHLAGNLVDSFEIATATGSFSTDCGAINAPPSALADKKWDTIKNGKNVSASVEFGDFVANNCLINFNPI